MHVSKGMIAGMKSRNIFKFPSWVLRLEMLLMPGCHNKPLLHSNCTTLFVQHVGGVHFSQPMTIFLKTSSFFLCISLILTLNSGLVSWALISCPSSALLSWDFFSSVPAYSSNTSTMATMAFSSLDMSMRKRFRKFTNASQNLFMHIYHPKVTIKKVYGQCKTNNTFIFAARHTHKIMVCNSGMQFKLHCEDTKGLNEMRF